VLPLSRPDEQARKKKLRLDTKDGAAKVLVAGKSAESELYLRVSSKDADEMMPPPKANRPLTAKQIEILKAWIDGGAKWGTPSTPTHNPFHQSSPHCVLRSPLSTT